jgi:hypothetical protein
VTTLNVSLFSGVYDTKPQLRPGITFAELVAILGPPKSYTTKDAPPFYSPGEWLAGHTRGNDGLVALHFGVLDLDHRLPDEFPELVARLRQRGLAYYLASTWSNGVRNNDRRDVHGSPIVEAAARLIVPFSRPVLVSEWPRFWRAMNEDVAEGKADQRSKEAAKGFYFPSFGEGRELEPFHDACTDGAVLDVDALLAKGGFAGFEASTPGPTAAPTASLTREALRNLGRVMADSQNAYRKDIGRLILRVVKGEPYAREPGTIASVFETGVVLPEGRNDTSFKIISKICEHFPHVEPQAIADIFKPSIMLMGGPEEHEIFSMVERLQTTAKQAHAQLIFEAIGQHEPYTDANIQAFADRAEISLTTLRRRWVIQKDRTYYILRHNGYRAYSEAEIENAAQVELAPAIRAGVDTQKITQQGIKPKSAKELVHDYGTIATGVIVDLNAQFSSFDDDEKKIIEAPCPVRVQPREHPLVAQWLQILAGPRYERLCHWLAVMFALNEPCAALYLAGAKGVGKSLLANGLSRAWTTEGPTAMKDIMGDFNDAFVRCPLLFADEKAPTDDRGRIRTDEIREMIQSRSRTLKRKFLPTATLRGCPRIIFAANNKNLIQTNEHLTEEDIAAIVERIFFVQVNPEAQTFFQSLPRTTFADWVDGDAIAEHAYFLAHTIQVPRTSRFLVSGEVSDLTNSLAVGTGLRSNIAHWLVSYLLDPRKFTHNGKAASLLSLVRVSHGRLMVTARAITEGWETYLPTEKNPPTPMLVSRALAGLSSEITLNIGQKNQKFRNVNIELLAEWAEQTGYATRKDLDEAMMNIEASAVVVRAN